MTCPPCTHDCNQGRTCPARAAVLQELEKSVEQEMARVCNEYAKSGNMIAATAVHDAYLCVQSHLSRVVKMLNHVNAYRKAVEGDQ